MQSSLAATWLLTQRVLMAAHLCMGQGGFGGYSYQSMLLGASSPPNLVIHPPRPQTTLAWTSPFPPYQPSKLFQPHRMVHASTPGGVVRQHPPPHLVVHHHHHIFHEPLRVKKPPTLMRPTSSSSTTTTTSTSTSSTTTSTTSSTTARPSSTTTSTQRTQLERKVQVDEEEGSGDGPFGLSQINDNRPWQFETKKESSKSAEDSFEFGHDYRSFHLGYHL